jgi:hypothetical protein
MQENPARTVSVLEPMLPTLAALTTSLTGGSGANPVLMPSAPPSPLKPETPSATALLSLKSHVKPHELLESPPMEPKVLTVHRHDLDALCQVIADFKEQFVDL